MMGCDPFDPFSACFHDFNLQGAAEPDLEELVQAPRADDDGASWGNFEDIPFEGDLPTNTLPPPAAHTNPQAPQNLGPDQNGSRWYDPNYQPEQP